MSDQHEGSCCAMCAWDYQGFCCCIPMREKDNESVAVLSQENLEAPIQENLQESTNNAANGDGEIPDLAKLAQTHTIRGCLLEIPNAWLELVHDIDSIMSLVDPDYELFQVKDKFGQLRYYWQTEKPHAIDMLDKIASMGERAATTICAMCGEWATDKNGYFNVCEAHKNND